MGWTKAIMSMKFYCPIYFYYFKIIAFFCSTKSKIVKMGQTFFGTYSGVMSLSTQIMNSLLGV